MPITINPKPSQVPNFGRGVKHPPGQPRYKMRIYRPSGNVDRVYTNMDRMRQWQQYYRDQGVKTRKI